jgi:hypothetical protein
MAQAIESNTTSRLSFSSAGAVRRTFSTPATLSAAQAAHVAFIGALSFQKPHNICADADHHAVQGRADHLKAVLAAVAVYVDAIVQDTVDSMSVGTDCIDAKYIADMLSDTSSDIVGQFHNACEAMIEAA